LGRLSGATYYFNGTVGEVFLLNKTLTSEEASDLFNNYGYTTVNYPGKILVCKYVSPKPVVTIGEEET